MAGLRDGLQHSRDFYLPEFDEADDQADELLVSRPRSAAQRVRNIGFSLRGSQRESAWKRRFGWRTTTPTETTVRMTLLIRSALIHGLSGILLAGAMTAIFLESGGKVWLWFIMLSMLMTGYSVGAYWCVGHLGQLSMARWLLLGGDLVVLAVLGLLLGPSSVLYLLFPCLVLLAAVLASRRDTVLLVALEAGVLLVLAVLDLLGLPHLQVPVRASFATLVTLFGSLLCLGWITGALLARLNRKVRAGGADHWNSAEIARNRIESDLRLRQLRDEVTTVQEVVSRAVAGELHARVVIREGELASLAARLNQLLNREEKMFEESRQHRKLERAVGELLALLEALHRGEHVGWPAPTGTTVDRILALMRAPGAPRTTAKLPAAQADLARSTTPLSSISAEVRRSRSAGASKPVAPPAFLRDAESRAERE